MSEVRPDAMAERDWKAGAVVARALSLATAGVPERGIVSALAHPTFRLSPEQADLAADVAWILETL